MANAPLVVTNAQTGAGPKGKIFDGLAFFLIQRVPQRNKFIADIEANGGKVVKDERVADYLIADHMRNDAPGGSYSYTFIQAAIRDGQLPNPGDHATGRRKGSVREIGSTAIAAKRTRTPFTAEDDRQLWQWVQSEKAAGASVKGNEMYKRLEAANPRHTHQAWRDRYVKQLMDKPPVGIQATDATTAPLRPASAALDGSEEEPLPAVPHARKQSPRKRQKVDHPSKVGKQPSVESSDGLQDDIELLQKEVNFIEDMPADREGEAWASFAKAYPKRTSQEWKELYITSVKPPLHAQAIRGSSAAVDQILAQAQLASAKGMTQSKKHKRVAPPREISQSPSDVPDATPDTACGRDIIQIVSSPHSIKTTTARRAYDVEVNASNSALHTAKEQIRSDSGAIPLDRHDDVLRDAIVTSDVNEAAEQQLQAESVDHLIASYESAKRQDPTDSNVMPTNEVNERDEVESQGYVQPPKHQSRDFFGRPRSDTPSSSVAAAVEEQNREEARSAAIETAGFALTEANLAAQEEQLREPKLRGVDLPEDDEMKDQSDFLKFLQHTMGVPITQPEAFEGVRDEQHSNGVDEDQMLPSTPILAAQSRVAHADDSTDNMPLRSEHVHLSSQEEVAEVLDSNLNWPMSPEQQRKRNEEQSLPFETQVHRTTTPPQAYTTEASSQFASRSLLSQINGVASSADDGVSLDQSPQHAGRLSPFPSSSQINYPEDTYNGEDLEGTDAGSEAGEIDLTLAEPEGGFGFTPSPERDQRLRMPLEAKSICHDSRGPALDTTARSTHGTNSGNFVEISSASPPSSSLESSVHSEGRHYSGAKRGGHALETQDIYNAETQVPDFGMPPPSFNGGPDETMDSRRLNFDETTLNLGRTNPPAAVSSQPEGIDPQDDQSYERSPDDEDEDPSSQDDAAKLEDWMATMQVRGYKEAAIVQALKCTSMRVDLAHLVLISTKAGKGVPGDVPGIWSEHEDSILESGNARGIRDLEAKHGWDECEARLNYLAEWRDA
ncbi:uncharacterized protein MYCFIDRAFT_192351 [Pseudocercospora fijiensis CIRAD86]|uniref:DNA-binding protein RAP1 n=1 Tax=Pseudocercospora fijiensis (strain CIRAD86) TaxID=383855 RepID=N1QAR3_PSEFD|nr:uncharacterized protein MYCFIDRAFT_192351 [Pseudocercospora fijiensis CIRAD86]EME88097.1 hypothetical protein MYCFIDRAFT_192351 [Pseudocercospora fijiensis CIRAD86]